MSGPLESWRTVWRNGFVPSLSTECLQALRKGLEADDPRLTQGCTTSPPPLMCAQDWPVEAGCALVYAGWQGEHLTTVGEAEEYFARCCFEADQRLGEAAACRWFLNFWDESPRDTVRTEMLYEVDLELKNRQTEPAYTDAF